MGLLRHDTSGRTATLSARTLIGRAPGCAVVLDEPRASAEHAVIAWTGQRWELQDLGSRNGTWLDGQRVDVAARVALARGARLGFGTADGPWVVADDRPPVAAARRPDGAMVHAAAGLLALPADSEPRATIYRGERGWIGELDGAAGPVVDGQQLVVDGAAWTLSLPAHTEPITRTVDGAAARPPMIAGIGLDLRVSADEEHVDVTVATDSGPVELPARSCHYMLATLARARLDDAARGVAAGEEGWLHAGDLARMLDYTAERLNVEIFRARALLARAGVVDAARLIERRTTSRQLRIGVERLVVRRP